METEQTIGIYKIAAGIGAPITRYITQIDGKRVTSIAAWSFEPAEIAKGLRKIFPKGKIILESFLEEHERKENFNDHLLNGPLRYEIFSPEEQAEISALL